MDKFSMVLKRDLEIANVKGKAGQVLMTGQLGKGVTTDFLTLAMGYGGVRVEAAPRARAKPKDPPGGQGQGQKDDPSGQQGKKTDEGK